MFRDDFEFNDSAAPSHLAAEGSNRIEEATASRDADGASEWEPAAHSELQKVPFFVRGKARRNTERFAAERGIRTITIETLYEAKSHYAR
jgi:light-independent protochlorophyllide reductase subunit B